MTMTIVANVLLGLALVATLLWLLGHLGVHKDRHHERRLHRWHRLRVAAGRRPRNVAG
jgi:hypothetical protein